MDLRQFLGKTITDVKIDTLGFSKMEIYTESEVFTFNLNSDDARTYHLKCINIYKYI